MCVKTNIVVKSLSNPKVHLYFSSGNKDGPDNYRLITSFQKQTKMQFSDAEIPTNHY